MHFLWRAVGCLAFVLAASLLAPDFGFAEEAALYRNHEAPLEARVEDLFERLTTEEKLLLLGGTGFPTQPLPRLGVPAMGMVDASQGVRGGIKSTEGPATAFPAGVLMASTWDPGLVGRVAVAIGEEARNKGTGSQVLLGPAVNIHRSPLGGRNAEYFTEDPCLAARLAVAYIQGMQSTGVAACVKHFACNNHEYDRFNMNVNVGERALREIYFPAFEAAVKEGKVWMVMSSYNKVNGTYSSANKYLLTDVLKRGWGFDGMVTSDWGGVHETTAVEAGNDLEMPDHKYHTVEKLEAALAAGTITQTAVDDSARRILRTLIRVGLLDGKPSVPDPGLVNSPAHRQLAYEAAAKGIVLLKNQENILPLDASKLGSVAVIGEPGRALQYGPLGSPKVVPLHATELVDAVRRQVGDSAHVRYATGRWMGEPVPGSAVTPTGGRPGHGFLAEYLRNEHLEGTPEAVRVEPEINLSDAVPPAPGFTSEHYSARWSGELLAPTSGEYTFTFRGDDGYRLFIDNRPLIDAWQHVNSTTSAGIELEGGKSYALRAEFYQGGGDVCAQLSWRLPGELPYAAAVEAARTSEVAILCVSTGREEGEGHDRPSMDLPDRQDDLIRAITAVNPRTVLVLNNGTPVTIQNWIDHVPGILEAWLPGQEGGAALADILFGKVNPSGRLPDTLAVKRDDYPDGPNFPGKDAQVNYDEGTYVGYRHFDKAGIKPLFPFGYGRSYTTFAWKNLRVAPFDHLPDGTAKVSMDITNTGAREGEETVQLYVRDPKPPIERPVRELKNFAKVTLMPGQTKTVVMTIHARDLAYFDVPGHQWKADAGDYEIELGASSRDIWQAASLRLETTFTESVISSLP